ncbi:MAG: hypothetical protein KY475_16190, partial [Planctomycetes bacterium]|nr:hypothetical protein [Planctomycetota bacterium]
MFRRTDRRTRKLRNKKLRNRRKGLGRLASMGGWLYTPHVELLEQRRVLAVIGPDSFGYVADDGIAFSYEDISGTGSALNQTDDDGDLVSLGFNFVFYGTSYSDVFVNSNGLLTFNSAQLDFSNEDLETTGNPPQPSIAPLWDDWDPGLTGSDDVYTQTLGTAPNRRFIAQWHDIEHNNFGIGFSGDGVVDFQVVLFESGAIEFRYNDVDGIDATVDDGRSATIGIRNAEPTAVADGEVLQYSFDTASIANNTALRIATSFELAIDADQDPGGDNTADNAAPDSFRLIRNGNNLEWFINGDLAGMFPISAIDSVTVNGSGDDDTLTVDYAGGALPFPVDYAGAGETNGDGLRVLGDGTNDAVYTPDASTTGNGAVGVDGNMITFTGLEPVDMSGMATATLMTPLTGANDTLTLQNGVDFLAGGTNQAIRVSGTTGDTAKGAGDGTAIEPVAFWDNGEVIIDTTQVDGDDVIDIDSADNAHDNVDLTIRTGSGDDDVNLNGDVLLDDADSDFSIQTQQINLGDGVGIDNIDAADAVSLDAGAGSISETGPNTIIAVNLVMRAGTGIGDASTSDDDIDVQVGAVAAETATGDIHIEDLDGVLTIGTLNLRNGTTITGLSITTGGAGDEILVKKRNGGVAADLLTVSSSVSNSGSGNITLAADGDAADDDFDVSANVTASGGDVLLVSYEDIESTAPGISISTTGEGNVSLHAGATFTFGLPVDPTAGNNDGDIFTGSPNNASIETEDGDILLTAKDNILLGDVNADADGNRTGAVGDAGNGDVTVLADRDGDNVGDIRDSLAGEGLGNENIIGGNVILSAALGVGDFDDLDVDAVQLDVTNTTGGSIRVADVAGGLVLADLDGDPNSRSVDGVGGGGSIVASSPLTISADASTTGGMTYTAADDNLDGGGAGMEPDKRVIQCGVRVMGNTWLVLKGGDRVGLVGTAGMVGRVVAFN